jgi:hypothetical protein
LIAGQQHAAERAAERCLGFQPKAGDVEMRAFLLSARGNALRLCGDYAAALTCLRSALEACPQRGGFWFNLGLLHKGSDGVERPVAYRLDDSGLLGGDDPTRPHCADVSYGGRTLTSDCAGFALHCAGIARKQPGYKGSKGEWLNTDSVLDDAHGQQRFFRTLRPGEEALPGDLVVTRSKYLLGVRIKAGHMEVLVRRAVPGFKAMTIGCSQRFGRDTAIGVGYVWSPACQVIRPLFYKEAA